MAALLFAACGGGGGSKESVSWCATKRSEIEAIKRAIADPAVAKFRESNEKYLPTVEAEVKKKC